ncbi:hypothetical protein MLD38_015263 [Melastoma candidum]|uniref:Uncharacterized protein n=1 Tax=Melastoma candidum TaxID=119954 RepID=A0ACB9RJ90_9MYRT|nr:hypothetical protein MLD38_015263 [Melastoma candidum]
MEHDREQSIVIKLSETDPFYSKKKKLLQTKGFDVEVSRIICLDETELYFRVDGSCTPSGYYTPKNELEALISVLNHLKNTVLGKNSLCKDVLKNLESVIGRLLGEFGDKILENPLPAKLDYCTKEKELLEWGKNNGVQSALQIAYIEGFSRGAIAVEDLNVGDVALEIPISVIITEEVLQESHLFPILQTIDGISTETMLLIWSMKERYNPSSRFKLYFETLPEAFNTGLRFGMEAIIALDGTILFEELMQAKEHLRSQYDELFPALCDQNPDLFPLGFYSWEQFLWACELWYSNSMKVKYPDGTVKTCLIPIAGFLNHSFCPHIMQYGRIDASSSTLKFPMSRPCRAGEQCYLSYGNYSSSHLVTFYGFLPEEDNPHDVIPLDIDDSPNEDGPTDSGWTTHMVRGTWLSDKHDIFHYGLPLPLLEKLRTARKHIVNDDDSSLPDELTIEIAVLEDLSSIFGSMLENLGEMDPDTCKNAAWDVKLAEKYKSLQRRIVSSILRSCESGLKSLQEQI